MRDSDETVAELLAVAQKLEGLYRHASTHAAGIVIGERPLTELVPMYRDPRSDMPVTQYSLKWVEPAGLVKFDFLGLTTLTVLDHAVKMINRNGTKFALTDIPIDDAETYERMTKGDVVGVFQVESPGMRRALVDMRPDRFEDLIALVALYRPGPMANIPTYCARKNGQEDVEYLHPLLEPILAPTYGVITYQEQVQQIAKVLAGYTLAEADLLRRAMGKKIKAEMEVQRSRFLEGAEKNGISRGLATVIFEACAKFAEYGFNKSHSAPYAYITYQTAYLKTHFFQEFMAASMTYVMANTDKLSEFREDAKKHGITIVRAFGQHVRCGVHAPATARSSTPSARSRAWGRRSPNTSSMPAVKRRSATSPISPSGSIRASSTSVRSKRWSMPAPSTARRQARTGVRRDRPGRRHRAAHRRQCQRRHHGHVRGRYSRADPAAAGRAALGSGRAARARACGDRLSHFGASARRLSGPVREHEDHALCPLRARRASEGDLSAGRLAGTIATRADRRTKKGTPMLSLSLSDPSAATRCIGFSEVVEQYGRILQPGASVILNVEADERPDGISLRLMSAIPIEEAAQKAGKSLVIEASSDICLGPIRSQLKPGGNGRITFVVAREQGRRLYEVDIGAGWQINPALAGAIKSFDGVVDVRLS